MQPLWKIRSGRFAGWKIGDVLYDTNGDNAGYFSGAVAYSLNGQYIGEIYQQDWIGKRSNVIYPIGGSRAGYAGVASGAYGDRTGLSIAAWEDPDF